MKSKTTFYLRTRKVFVNKLCNSIVFTLATLFLASVQASTVKAIKGNKALIEIQDETLVPGEQYYLINSDGKRTALIVIKQVKGNRALADITKGKGTAGQTIQSRAATEKPLAPKTPKGDYAEDFLQRSKVRDVPNLQKALKSSWGIQAGLNNNSMVANVATRDLSNNVIRSQADMAGSSFSLLGFYDKPLTSSLVLHIAAGYEMFNVSGSTSQVNGSDVNACSNSTSCSVDISYISGHGLIKWYPTYANKYRIWLGGGLGYMMNMSSSSNALSGIGATAIYTAALGTDIQFSHKNYMPISVSYGMFPDSPTVKASMMTIKIGWGWNL